ncbi:hypothetical protein QCA50_012333 [Cerrena zonata]|uniref:Uncharacterized protein n=1 Tax=Cerrena zonata TaxID=2478898 RepID=A0AAW0FU59_9APHY
MSVFNPKILDASLRDVTGSLSDEEKADVLLYAMERLHIDRSRVLIENAVQSCLLVSKLSPESATKARLLRAKARLACSLRDRANQDLEAILILDPEHPEARALMAVPQENASKSRIHTLPGQPRFSTEIWRQIALWLPRRDLKTLLLVPHVLSRIASQLLFRKIDLHFGSDKWDSQRSADILTRIITDSAFANLIRTLRIFVPGRDVVPMTFQTGMLANALPKLTNLQNVHCSMRWKDMYSFLRILETINHRLFGLSLMPSDGTGELRFPKFKHITQFSYSANGGNPTEVYEFLARNKGSIRTIHLQNLNWSFPSDVISIRNLTHLDFLGTLQADSRALADVLHNGHQLESLRLQCMLECSASVQFRDFANSLPFLRHFSLVLLGYRVNDHDFFPALSDFLRGRTQLRTLQLIVPSADYAHRRLGYDANVWGVLPSLMNLQSLSATLPKDVAAAVAMWLVPRSVQSLSLHNLSTESVIGYVSQLRPGLPPGLKFIGISQSQIDDVTAVIEHGFPTVKLARFDEDYYTVTHPAAGQVKLEEWPKARTRYNAKEWLEWFECEDAEWRDPADFL